MSALPVFRDYYDQQRALGDQANLLIVLVELGAVLIKYRHIIANFEGSMMLFNCALAACILAWVRMHPNSYIRHREVIVSLTKLWIVKTSRIGGLSGATAVFQTADNFWQRGTGLLQQLTFLGGLLLGSNLVALLQHAFVFRLCLGVHAIVHMALLGVTMAEIPSLCECQALQQPESKAFIGRLHSLFELLGLHWVYHPTSSAQQHTPTQKCWAVVALLQVGLGYALPTVLLAVWESRDFLRFKELTCTRYRSTWCSWLYERVQPSRAPGGWLRRLKLAVASWLLFSILWDILYQQSARRVYLT